MLLSAIAVAAVVWISIQAYFDHDTIEATFEAIDESIIMSSWHRTTWIWFGALLPFSTCFINPAFD